MLPEPGLQAEEVDVGVPRTFAMWGAGLREFLLELPQGL